MASTLKVDTITTPDGTGNITFSRPIVGNLTAQKNVIINGDFNIWQRGTSFAPMVQYEVGADRWRYQKASGTAVHTISRDTDVPTVAESGHLSNYSMKIDCTTADASIATSDQYRMLYVVEGYDFAPLAQKALTLSFWHKHTKTGVYCVSFTNNGSDRCYITEYTQSVTDTWEKATLNFDASPSGGTWDYTTSKGITIDFSIAMGTDYHATADTWNSSNDFATSNQVNACDSTSNNFMLAQVQLELGSTASDFEIRDHTTELAMCKRYYEKLNNTGNVNWRFGAVQCVSTTVARGVIRWETEKRAAPTITSSAVDYFSLTQSDYTKEAVTALTFATSDVWSARADISVAGNLVAGDVTLLESDASNAATIDISAEL
jgi:hypothetical protein